MNLIKTGTESLLVSLCAQHGVPSETHEEKRCLKYLEKCLLHGISMSKTSSHFCQWFCEALGDLLESEELQGQNFLYFYIVICNSYQSTGRKKSYLRSSRQHWDVQFGACSKTGPVSNTHIG